jgi:alkyldihydroxyacetonephosphate synthase
MTAQEATGAAIAGERIERLRGRLGEIPMLTDPEVLRETSRDTYWKAAALASSGRAPVADAVVRPRSAEEVAVTLAAAAAEGVPVVPRGGGSGSQGGAVPDAGGVVLDLGGLDQILELDEAALTVRAQAGVPGLRLEEWLNERGYTFPHYPASLHLAQVGGYLAAKGSGVLSTKYGKIEDLVGSIEVALPSGELVRTVPIPRHAVGPDLNQLFIGSEGTLGVITEATLLIRPLPEHRSFRLVAFDDLAAGIEAMRRVLQAGWRPAAVRLHDPEATRVNLARILDADVSGVVLVLVFDGPRPLVETEEREVLRSLTANGGRDQGPELAESWWENRFRIYYPPFRPELPSIWGTIDLAAGFGRILPAFEAVRELMQAEYSGYGLTFTGHFSHWYPWGTMVYGRFVLDDPPDDVDAAVTIYEEIWRRSSEVILREGAVINDHHGVGLKLAGDMRAQYGSAWPLLQEIKRAIDPDRVMNPNKLGL